MSKKMNNKAPEKSADQCKGMEAKRGSKSTQVDLCESAFEGVNDAAERLPATPTAQVRASHEAALQHPNSDERTDLADPQHRDVKACASPSLEEVKDRIKAARRRGPSRPLAALSKAEADLETRSEALLALSTSRQKTPDEDLLIHQLSQAVNTSDASRTTAPKLRRDTISLFSSLDSNDPIESILDRHIVAMSVSAMHCQARAAFAGNPKALDTYLRHFEKMTKVLIELVEARERRRRPKQVVVGNVNVEAGGQAIVGNVEPQSQRTRHRQSIDEETDE